MSFVVAAPEQVQTAAQGLAGIHTTLAEASGSVAAPTTAMAAAAEDQVSAGVAAIFNAFGQEYQVVSVETQAFHAQFVNLLNAGATAYLGTDVANAQQNPLNAATAPVPGLLGQSSGAAGPLLSGQIATGLPGLPGSLTALKGVEGLLQPAASTGAGPYQTLFQNTVANWQTFTGAIAANPNPFLHQVITNQVNYAKTVSSQLAYIAQNFPAVLAGVPASIQAGIQGLLAFNPSPYVQQIIINQMIYAELAYSSLQSAGGYFTAGLQALPPHLEAAFQFTLAGNYTAAQGELFEGALGLLIAPPGVAVTGESTSLTITTHHYSLFPFFNGDLPTSVVGNVDAGIVPVGTLGSLFPLFAIPGMEAQGFTNLLPGGSIAQQIAQNLTNAVNTVSDTSILLGGALDLGLDWGPGSLFPSNIPPIVTNASLGLSAHFGLPLALLLDAAGGPVNVWDAFNASTQAFNNAALSGHYAQAASALVNAPAKITNAFLNGQSTLPLSADLDGLPITLDIPLDGILVGPTPASLTLDSLVTLPIGGTPLSGFAYGVYYASQQLANAITP